MPLRHHHAAIGKHSRQPKWIRLTPKRSLTISSAARYALGVTRARSPLFGPSTRFMLATVGWTVLMMAGCHTLSDDLTTRDPEETSTEVGDSTEPEAVIADPCLDESPEEHAETWPLEAWRVTCPETQNMDSIALERVREYALFPPRKTQSVLIIRNGNIVAEWYHHDRGTDSHATSWSVAKSFLSALVGIAIDRGELPSADEPLATYVPALRDEGKADITFRHALQMRSGLRPHSPENIYWQSDQLAYSLYREMEEEPGQSWNYQNGDSMLVSHALESALGRDLQSYAQEVLFDPIGMEGRWWTDAQDHVLGYCCIDATPRDFARFGLLFERGGSWAGQQVVSTGWVSESTTPVADDMPYALHWWAFEEGGYYAAIGALGQSIWIFPAYNLVALRNSYYTKRGNQNSYRVHGADYHDTPEQSGWDDGTFLELVFDAVKDYEPDSEDSN